MAGLLHLMDFAGLGADSVVLAAVRGARSTPYELFVSPIVQAREGGWALRTSMEPRMAAPAVPSAERDLVVELDAGLQLEGVVLTALARANCSPPFLFRIVHASEKRIEVAFLEPWGASPTGMFEAHYGSTGHQVSLGAHGSQANGYCMPMLLGPSV